MDVGSSIIYHLERHINSSLTSYVLRHGTQGFHVKTTESLGVAGFSGDVTKTLITRLQDHKQKWIRNDEPCHIDQTIYDLDTDNFDFSQLPKWLLIIVTEHDLSVQENITAICRWCRRVWSWELGDCLVIALGSTSPPSKVHNQGLIRNKITELCQKNPELQELRQNRRLRTFHVPHWDSIDNIEPEFVSLLKEWLNDIPKRYSNQEKSEKEHLPYCDISKMIIRDLRHSMPNFDIFFRLLFMCILGCVSVAITLLMIASVSRGGGLDYDIRKAQEYLVSHLEARRTGKSEWGRIHNAGFLTSLQISNPHWCFETVENQRSVDRLEIGILSLLSRLSSKSESVPPFTPLRLSQDINALLATFQNPRDFHEHDLVAMLKRYVTDVIPFTTYTAHAYSHYVLALCNSATILGREHAQRILKKRNKDGSFFLGINEAAISLLALSCIEGIESELSQIEATVQYIRHQRRQDGSYGSLYTTALVLQIFNINGLSIDSTVRREATLSWLARNSYSNKALKDPVVASAVLLALSGKNYLDISTIIGTRRQPHLNSGFGRSDKFRFLKPDGQDKEVHSPSRHSEVIKDVKTTGSSGYHQNHTPGMPEIPKQNLQINQSSTVEDSNKGELDRTLQSVEEEKDEPVSENGRYDQSMTEKHKKTPRNSKGKSSEHRWKKWKKSASYFDESDLEVEMDSYRYFRQESHLTKKSKSTFNDRTLESVLFGRCVL